MSCRLSPQGALGGLVVYIIRCHRQGLHLEIVSCVKPMLISIISLFHEYTPFRASIYGFPPSATDLAIHTVFGITLRVVFELNRQAGQIGAE